MSAFSLRIVHRRQESPDRDVLHKLADLFTRRVDVAELLKELALRGARVRLRAVNGRKTQPNPSVDLARPG